MLAVSQIEQRRLGRNQPSGEYTGASACHSACNFGSDSILMTEEAPTDKGSGRSR